MAWAKKRPSTSARGYGSAHQQLRVQWVEALKQGARVPCARGCGTLIVNGMRWHLDHSDDRTTYLGISCERCNLSAAGRAGKPKPIATRRKPGGKLGRIA